MVKCEPARLNESPAILVCCVQLPLFSHLVSGIPSWYALCYQSLDAFHVERPRSAASPQGDRPSPSRRRSRARVAVDHVAGKEDGEERPNVDLPLPIHPFVPSIRPTPQVKSDERSAMSCPFHTPKRPIFWEDLTGLKECRLIGALTQIE